MKSHKVTWSTLQVHQIKSTNTIFILFFLNSIKKKLDFQILFFYLKFD